MTIKRKNHGRGHSYWDGDTKLDGVTTLINDGLGKKLDRWAARTVAEFVADRLAERDGHVVADDLIPALAALNKNAEWPEWDRSTFSRLALAKVLAGVPYAERDAAANRGQEIHRLAEKLAAGEKVEVPDEIAGHVDSCVRFLDDYDAQLVGQAELVVVNRTIGYAGTADAVFDLPTLPGAPRGLIDWKTGRNVYAETALQLAAYRHAESYLTIDGKNHDERPMSELGITASYVVHLRADGYDVYPIASDERVFNLFRHVAYLARWSRWDKDSRSSRIDSFKGPALRPAARQEAAS